MYVHMQHDELGIKKKKKKKKKEVKRLQELIIHRNK